MGKRRIKKWDWPWEGGGSLAVLGLSFLQLISSTANPFIYYRF